MTKTLSGLSLVNELNEGLHALNQRLGQCQCYLLMQIADVRNEDDERFQQALLDASLEPFQVRLPKLPPRLWPVLIPLQLTQGMHSATSALAMEIALADTETRALRRGQVQRSCAWIFTDMAIASLAHRLTATAVVPYQGSGRKRWLRYYDPMVTDLFWRVCSPEQQAYLLRGIACWAYVNRWNGLETLWSPVDPPAQNLCLSALAWEYLEGVGALNQAWIRACCEGLAIGHDQFWAAVAALQQGYRYGLRKREDLDLFAWQAITLGPNFHTHDQVQTFLKQLRNGHDYAEMAYQLDDAQWHRIGLEVGSPLPLSTQERASS